MVRIFWSRTSRDAIGFWGGRSATAYHALQRDPDRVLLSKLTLQAVGSISELQSEVIIGGAVGIQGPRHLPAANESMLPAQHDDRTVNQFHDELLRLTWTQKQDFHWRVSNYSLNHFNVFLIE